MLKQTSLILLVIFALFACNQPETQETTQTDSTAQAEQSMEQAGETETSNCITSAEVIAAQEKWGEGIVNIGKVFSEGGDYTQAAKDHIQNLYGYDMGMVLFKPTLAAEDQFRESFDAALSYFVGGNSSYPEDKGFAIAPYTNVRWENSGIYANVCDMAVAMGNYYFTTQDGNEVKVEYTFGYVKDDEGKLRIVVHKSALPYNPNS